MLGLTKAPSLTGEVRARTEKRSDGLILPTAGDCVFLRRVILQSRSDGESQLIQSKALELEQLLQTMPIAGELPIEEECPACKSEIPFRNIRTASCNNGHPWSERLNVNSPESFCLLAWKQFSSMFDHHARTCDFSCTDVPRVHTKDICPCPVGFRWSSACNRGEPVDSRGPTSRDPMFILWESFCVLALASFASFKFLRWFARVSLCYDVTVLAPSDAGVYRNRRGRNVGNPVGRRFFSRNRD